MMRRPPYKYSAYRLPVKTHGRRWVAVPLIAISEVFRATWRSIVAKITTLLDTRLLARSYI